MYNNQINYRKSYKCLEYIYIEIFILILSILRELYT